MGFAKGMIIFILSAIILIIGCYYLRDYLEPLFNKYEAHGIDERDFTDFKGNKIPYKDYLKFSSQVSENIKISYVYLIDENKKKRYLGECLYFEEIEDYETASSLSGSSLTLLGEIHGSSVKKVNTGKIKLYMIEFKPFRWYEMIIPMKSVFLITGKYIEDINEFTL